MGYLRHLYKRIDELEGRISDNAVPDAPPAKASTPAHAAPEQEVGEEEEEEVDDGPAGPKFTDPEMLKVDLAEEMQRLRRVIECMEEAMPDAIRQRLDFFKRNARGKPPTAAPKVNNTSIEAGSNPTSADRKPVKAGRRSPVGLEEVVRRLQEESDERGQVVTRCSQDLVRDRANTSKLLRGYEKNQNELQVKVEDMWKRLPELCAILAPLQVNIIAEGGDCGAALATAEGGTPSMKVQSNATVAALKPLAGLIEATLQKSVDDLRRDLGNGIADVHTELLSKANTDDVSMLKDNVDSCVRSTRALLASRSTSASSAKRSLSRGPSAKRGQRPSTSGMSKSASSPGVQADHTDLHESFPVATSPQHSKCKMPTSPAAAAAAQSVARLGTRPAQGHYLPELAKSPKSTNRAS